MILLEIDAESISGIEFEGDAPRSIDMDRIAPRDKTFQNMKIEPWKVHLFRGGRDLQAIEAHQDALVDLGVDFRRAAFSP